MARMYGKIKYKFFNSCRRGCCTIDFDKQTVKRAEESLAFREAEEEMYQDSDLKHANGLCYNPNGQGYGCDECYNNDDPYYNEDLESIPGVWCDMSFGLTNGR